MSPLSWASLPTPARHRAPCIIEQLPLVISHVIVDRRRCYFPTSSQLLLPSLCPISVSPFLFLFSNRFISTILLDSILYALMYDICLSLSDLLHSVSQIVLHPPYYNWAVSFLSMAAAAKSLQSCLTLCDPIEGSPPGSRPWDSPGKNTGVGSISFSDAWKWKV